ncbi:MAG: hypothetical protein IKR76_06080 [Ruminococcus sp.]|nr:hypothetical protein [Ruminococcus sp.]
MVTVVIDDTAYELLKQWAYDFSDLVIRFCDNFEPMFKVANIIYQVEGKDAVYLRYNIDGRKVAKLGIMSTEKDHISFFVYPLVTSPTHYCLQSKFEKVATFYIELANVFVTINALLLFKEFSASAKRAMKKKTLFDSNKHTYFTLRTAKNRRTVLDTCKVTPVGVNYIIE